MRYAEVMKWNRKHPRGGKAQYMGFSTLGPNERRETPWLGSAWFEPGMKAEREEFIRKWKEETARLLKENPDLKIV